MHCRPMAYLSSGLNACSLLQSIPSSNKLTVFFITRHLNVQFNCLDCAGVSDIGKINLRVFWLKLQDLSVREV